MKVFDIVTDKSFLRKKCEEVSLPLSDEDRTVGLAVVNSNDDEIVVLTSNGFGKRT